MVPVLVPPLDLGEQPLRIAVWHVRQGAFVQAGDRLLEILAGDLVVELAAPAEGALRKRALEDDRIAVGQVVGEIG
jgi:pyruvate/2-oxoglutarate dehydrogenase complex dihydrolipoamide acyltransferase (E2) component